MATWTTHLRVAQAAFGLLPQGDFALWCAGNVAPDCGWGERDSFSGFTPPTTVTHWTSTGNKADIDSQGFFDRYVKNCRDTAAFSFYMGYWTHLLTDIKWSREIYMPTRSDYRREYERDPHFLNVIKRDWHDIDYEYLRAHPGLEPLAAIAQLEGPGDYLPYYEKGQLKKQTRFIAQTLLTMEKPPIKERRFLTAERVELFVREMTAELREDLANIFP